ncbi:GDSL esterase/lipase At5g42170 isoform X2 [Arabidopsis lyrata subsp. lyrata]|uniref:GDSL esterase/lipase At5g42170 isoform X2 n=1 Tax=Arabidopsis lyrata subsp. lyrata TaxID=81972 RepID=UPI000A29D199|nr:GDSL esterase/lipase At5g42170 isoform X2 [Arabidopsis lyrata subsp. lyrata]|eukprot:XP_002865563.2 GDSL esterase/lipase At5g42170 isoform X2 [Arabidopsis lyrata subsp. lyrata]
MSRLVYIIFLLVVVEGSRNTLDQNTETNASEAKVEAERLGIAEAIPAYLNPKLKNEDLLKGINFASGGSGYDPLTAKLVKVVSLSDQLKYFQEYKEKIKGIVGEEKANFIVKNSLYLVVASSNDIAHTYTARSLKYNRTSYADYLAGFSSEFVRELYGLGARRIGVFSAVPVGCVPAARTVHGRLKRKCSDKLNEVARHFNVKMFPTLEALGKELPDSKIAFIDVYDTLNDMIENPKNYGFEVSNRGCCGTGLLEVLFLCNKINPFTCKNSSSYIFWDSYHPTEKAYQIIVDKLLGKYIKQLV